MKLYIGIIVYTDHSTKIVSVSDNYFVADAETKSKATKGNHRRDPIALYTVKEVELSIYGEETE